MYRLLLIPTPKLYCLQSPSQIVPYSMGVEKQLEVILVW